MGRSRYGIDDPQATHFLTCTIANWLPVFTRPATVNIILDSLRYLQSQRGMTIYGYVILENHMHFIAESEDLGRDVMNFKSYTAKQIVKCLLELRAGTILKQMKFYKKRGKADRDYQVWQEGSHPQELLNLDMLRQKLEYIHN